MVILLMLAANNSFSSREELDEAINDTERAIRFGMDESALRNVIIRLHFFHDKVPTEYALEYGPSDNFVLPISLIEKQEIEEDAEERKKQSKKFNKDFNKIKEFQDSNKKFPSNIKLIGVGSKLTKRLITEFHSSIYLFPTGEKDASIIIFASDEEVAELTIEGFIDDYSVKYHKLDLDIIEDELEDKQIEKAQEIYEEWVK
jgi:hypothetical protein